MKNLLSCIVIASLSVIAGNSIAPQDEYQTSTNTNVVSEFVSDVKGLVGMGTNGMDEVMGGGNDQYLRDFASGNGVSDMIK